MTRVVPGACAAAAASGSESGMAGTIFSPLVSALSTNSLKRWVSTSTFCAEKDMVGWWRPGLAGAQAGHPQASGRRATRARGRQWLEQPTHLRNVCRCHAEGGATLADQSCNLGACVDKQSPWHIVGVLAKGHHLGAQRRRVKRHIRQLHHRRLLAGIIHNQGWCLGGCVGGFCLAACNSRGALRRRRCCRAGVSSHCRPE